MKKALTLSTLAQTCIFDLDGTICIHNGYKTDGKDTLLEGVREYFDTIPDEDKVIIFTSRTEEYREETVRFLQDNHIRYDEIMFDMPMGERIVVNDRKPSGIDMAVSINIDRNQFVIPEVVRRY